MCEEATQSQCGVTTESSIQGGITHQAVWAGAWRLCAGWSESKWMLTASCFQSSECCKEKLGFNLPKSLSSHVEESRFNFEGSGFLMGFRQTSAL